jgi:hypothetical protein
VLSYIKNKKICPFRNVPGNIKLWVTAENTLSRTLATFRIKVRAAVTGDCLATHPPISLQKITGNHYRVFPQHVVSKLLQIISLTLRTRMWYMWADVPEHCSPDVRDVHSKTYHDWGGGRGGNLAWSPRRSELNSLGFYPWALLGTRVRGYFWQGRGTSSSHFECLQSSLM